MICPFLKEARVKYCRTSSLRKLIPLAHTGHTEERCSSENYTGCPIFRQQPDATGLAAFGICPFLSESLMQYCGAASVAKFVPYSESLLSRCGNDSYRYCELYLQMAHPLPPPETADGIAMPEELGYSPNHMWVDVSADGVCHAGIDAFLSRVLGEVESLTFVWQKGHHRPTAVVTAGGIEREITLPIPLTLTACNLYLRANPGRLTSEPYTRGWLFEGVPDAGTLDGLLRGRAARQWMDAEVRHISEFLQGMPSPSGRILGQTMGQTVDQTMGQTMADGGLFCAGLARHIEREQMFALFDEFFSPLREQERKS
jgi:glycine cleavage system H lipoate-binding protein